MIKKGAAIFFSGTGNTKYICKLFKERFKKDNINIDLIDIQRHEKLDGKYDLYIIGSPIHVEMPPKILVDWMKNNIPNGSEKCIIVHTLGDKGHRDYRVTLAKIMNDKGYDIVINESITMPNNYYHILFKRDSDEYIKTVLGNAPSKVDDIVKDFYSNKKSSVNYKKDKKSFKMIYEGFLMYTKKYPKRRFSLNENKCINCKICELECPTKNICMENKKITFYNKCIGCGKCIHRCPTNAILYKNKDFQTYKIERYIKK